MEPSRIIRCSSLPTMADCPRRWLATQRRMLLESAGYQLDAARSGIGAPIGSGVHAGVAVSWRDVSEPGADWAPEGEATDATINTVRIRAAEAETIFDDTAPTLNDAEQAALKMLGSYREHVARDRVASLLEREVGGPLGNTGFALSGHVDIYSESVEAMPDMLEDVKTGRKAPACMPQLGAYRIPLRASGQDVGRVAVRFFRRPARTKMADPPVLIPMDPDVAETVARATIARIITAQSAFERDGNLLHFPANPASMLCTAAYCPAYRTRACPESAWKPA